MPLTRRVQVFISQEASDALDNIVRRTDLTQTAAIEHALMSFDADDRMVTFEGSQLPPMYLREQPDDSQPDTKPPNQPKNKQS